MERRSSGRGQIRPSVAFIGSRETAMNETPQPPPLESTIVGYCRACGKALDQASVHTAHGTIYCREHVPLDDAGASPYTSSTYSSNTPPAGSYADVSPGLAFMLGLIPGVGAIY